MGRLTESRKEVTGISWQLPQIIAQATFSRRDLETLRAGLTDLVSESITTTNIGPGLTSARQFLVSSLAAVCVRLIALEDENGETLRASALALRLVDREYGEEKPSESLRRILAGGRPSLRERMFVAGDALSQSLEARDDAWNRFYEAAFHGPTRPDAARDSSWVLARLGNPTEAIDLRAVFLEYAFELARSESDPRTAIGALRPLVADDPQLLERISERLRPARRNRRWAAWEAKAAKREQQSKRKDLRHRASWIAFWREVSQHPEKVFADDRVDNTAWNLWHAMARSGQEGRGSGWKREFLERFFRHGERGPFAAGVDAVLAKRTTDAHQRTRSRSAKYLHDKLAAWVGRRRRRGGGPALGARSVNRGGCTRAAICFGRARRISVLAG